MNLVKYIQRNSDLFVSNSYDNVTQAVQTALELVASNKEWFVQVYEDKAAYDVYQASRCVDCFSVFNVNSSYHIFVAGIDANSLPNPAIQFHNWIDFERQKNYLSDLQMFVDDVFNTYCINGVLAVQNDVQNKIAYPDHWSASGYIFVKDQFQFLAWSVQDSCPSWN